MTAKAGSHGRFDVTVKIEESTAVVALSGELDLTHAPVLRDALDAALEGEVSRVLIDCANLGFCDSTGLNALLAARSTSEPKSITVELAAMQPAVARLFEITGAIALFRTYPTASEALRALQ
ncbi:STAS domain-containing protein [Streptomyces sp. NPDC058274]|uniref:STAS domain-containing protein n=1 Tax=Streptomyces sp. NPDC058274 TaxID=3346416 RepID=UPI0036EF08C4